MNRILAVVILIILSAAAGHCAAGDQPVALIFPVTHSSGAMPDMANEATQALKTYLRQTQKVDATVFDPASSIIQRALAEHRLAAGDMVATESPATRLKIGKLVGVDYVVSGELKYSKTMKLDLWMANVASGMVWGFPGEAVVSSEGRKALAISNAIQTAASRVVAAAADVALSGIRAGTSVPPIITTEDPSTIPPATDTFLTMNDALKHVQLAEGFVKSGDLASAIQEFRRAIDSDPKNIDARVRLAQIYERRQMFSQARDELERARTLDPKNESVREELVKLEEARSAPVKPSATAARPSTTPKGLVASGDAAWKSQRLDEAEKLYRQAIAANESDLAAHERLGLLLAAMGRFDGAKQEVEQVRQIDPRPDLDTLTDRYARIQVYVTRHTASLQREYDTDAASFENHKIVREDYYRLMQSFSTRVESLIRLASVLTPPEPAISAQRHQSLGLSLMSQACGHTIAYLESNKPAEKDDAATMMAEARKELAAGK